jgi:hypothetical protein
MKWSEKLVEYWWGCFVIGIGAFLLGLMERRELLKLESGENKFVLVDPVTNAAYTIAGTGGAMFLRCL